MRVTGRTALFVILGDPVEHSLSPAMQNAALRAAGIDGLYVPWQVKAAGLPVALASLREMENFGGANVTLPHKEQAVSLVDDLSSEAAWIGAVNTVVPQTGRLLGANTDGQGFLRSLVEEGGYQPKGQRALIHGAGGAARAVAWSLAGAGIAELLILNRTVARAEALADSVARAGGVRARALAPGDPRAAPEVAGCTLVVNATSVGLNPSDALPIDPNLLRFEMLVYDLVYRPRETPLLREATRRGCRVQDGMGMLLHQGALAFELWTGRTPPLDAMRTALVAALT